MNNNIDDMITDILRKMEDVGFPQQAAADWVNTNHFEIHNFDDEGSFYWLDCWGALGCEDWRPNPQSERLGVVLDMACMTRALIDEIDRLREELKEVRNEDSRDD